MKGTTNVSFRTQLVIPKSDHSWNPKSNRLLSWGKPHSTSYIECINLFSITDIQMINVKRFQGIQSGEACLELSEVKSTTAGYSPAAWGLLLSTSPCLVSALQGLCYKCKLCHVGKNIPALVLLGRKVHGKCLIAWTLFWTVKILTSNNSFKWFTELDLAQQS